MIGVGTGGGSFLWEAQPARISAERAIVRIRLMLVPPKATLTIPQGLRPTMDLVSGCVAEQCRQNPSSL